MSAAITSEPANGPMTLNGRIEMAACSICGAFVYLKIVELQIDTRQIHADWHERHGKLR